MLKTLRPALILLLITAVTGLLVGYVQKITAEPIRIAREREKAEALQRALPAAEAFREFETGELPPGVLSIEEGVADERTVGLCVMLDSSGYAGPIRLIVGIDLRGAITGLEIVSHTETPGLGSNAADAPFRDLFKGASAPLKVVKQTAGEGEIEALSGATITTNAVVEGVNRALELFGEVKGKVPGDRPVAPTARGNGGGNEGGDGE